MFDNLHDKIKEHFLANPFAESCGVIIDDDYVPCKNAHSNPAMDFMIDPKFTLKNFDKIQAVVHSHPKIRDEFGRFTGGNFYPSKSDMASQIASGKLFGLAVVDGKSMSRILWWGTDEARNPELIKRGFIHGIQDCWSLIRDWYWFEKGIRIKDFARNHAWWDVGESMYSDYFGEAGFVELPSGSDLQVGDMFLMSLGGRGGVENHGGLYIGGGVLLHHIGSPNGYDKNRYATKTPLTLYQRRITRWVRYNA